MNNRELSCRADIHIAELKKLKHKDIVRFALFCAYQVKAGWKDYPECVEAIRVTELWLEDKATADECRQVGYIAYVASNTVNATYAAYSAVYTTYSAYNAGNAASHAAYVAHVASSIETLEAQWNYYHELLNFDKNFEEIVLGVR